MTRSALLLFSLAMVCAPAQSADPLPSLRPILPTDSLLIVSPHPDDESLCCAGLIHTARRNGAAVSAEPCEFEDGTVMEESGF